MTSAGVCEQSDVGRAKTGSADPAPQPALYVHVPFCEALCSYCDFYSVALANARGHRFVDAIRAEAAVRAPGGLHPRTVFIGGGTPTALTDREFQGLLASVRGLLADGHTVDEWTVECNPNSLDAPKARAMHDAGVTRVSIGVQSFDDRVLKFVGRVHDAADAVRAVETARAAGIERISVDLLFAIPGQGLDSFRRDLDTAVALDVEHVSAYGLLYEEGTALTRLRDAGAVEPEDVDVELRMLRLARDVLGSAGLERYEISNFARPGAECRHNLNYWRNGEYLGLGPAAAGYLGGERRTNVRSWREYERRTLAGQDPIEESERLEPARAMAEEIMLRLRMREGFSLLRLGRRWGFDVRRSFGRLLGRLSDETLISTSPDGDTIALTPRGLEVADTIMTEFLATPIDRSTRL